MIKNLPLFTHLPQKLLIHRIKPSGQTHRHDKRMVIHVPSSHRPIIWLRRALHEAAASLHSSVAILHFKNPDVGDAAYHEIRRELRGIDVSQPPVKHAVVGYAIDDCQNRKYNFSVLLVDFDYSRVRRHFSSLAIRSSDAGCCLSCPSWISAYAWLLVFCWGNATFAKICWGYVRFLTSLFANSSMFYLSAYLHSYTPLLRRTINNNICNASTANLHLFFLAVWAFLYKETFASRPV